MVGGRRGGCSGVGTSRGHDWGAVSRDDQSRLCPLANKELRSRRWGTRDGHGSSDHTLIFLLMLQKKTRHPVMVFASSNV